MSWQSSQQHGRVLLIGFLLIFGVTVWYVGRAWYLSQDRTSTEATTPTNPLSLTDLRFLTPKEILARKDRQEKIVFLDVRPPSSYAVEHILDAVSIPVQDLNTYAPEDALLIIVSGPEVSNDTLKQIHLLFTERKLTFAFLQGSLIDWRLAGGSTISSGDPESALDYAKVIFIEVKDVIPVAQSLVSPFFLDVRDQSQYQSSHIPDSLNIPLDELERRREEIPRQKSLFVYGSNDLESYQGAVRLFDLGFFGVRALRGGFGAWREAALPVTNAPMPPAPLPTP